MPLITGNRAVTKAYIGATELNAIMYAGVNLLDGTVLPSAGRTFLMSKSSLILKEGTGGPTWSRATTAWRFNDQGYLRKIPSGCAEFGGARLVRNKLHDASIAAPSEDLSGAGWDGYWGVTTPNATTIVCANASGVSQRVSTAGSLVAYANTVIFMSGRFTYVDHDFFQFRPYGQSSPWGFVNLNLRTGEMYTDGVGVSSYGSILVSENVYDFWAKFVCPTDLSSNATYLVQFVESITAARGAFFAGDGVKSCRLTRMSLVDVTGKDASYVPEYVSVGSDVGKNFLLHTDDFSQSAWVKQNVTITQSAIANPINGRVDAQKVEVASTAAAQFSQTCTGSGSSGGNIVVVYVKQGSGASHANRYYLNNTTTSANILGISIDYSTGAITYLTGSSGATAESVGDGWWKITLAASSGFSSGDSIQVYIGFPGGVETAGESIYVYRPYLGRGTTAPEVIPAVAGTWDPHGAGIDGAKYFETDWQGAPIPAANLRRFRRESAATNNLLHSRDLSNAAWSTKTNITANKTATGIDGIANTATTLTATAADAIILQPTSGIASAARCASAYVERVSGTGTISFTQDGGSTWTDITALITAATYIRAQITATLANPSVGFKISTSGDVINVDVGMNEAGSVATSPIVTTTTTISRAVDSLTYQTTGNIDAALGTLFCEYSVYEETIAAPRAVIGLSTTAATANALLLHATGVATSSLSSGDGTTIFAKTGLGSAVNTKRKAAVSWGAGRSLTAEGLAPQAGAFSGTLPSTAIAPGAYTSGTLPTLNGYIGHVAIYNYQMTDAELQAITA